MVSHGIRATFYSGRRRINSFLPVTGIGRSKEKKVLTTTMHTMCWQGISVWYTGIICMAGRGPRRNGKQQRASSLLDHQFRARAGQAGEAGEAGVEAK